MPITVKKIRIFVASPGDVETERDILDSVIKELNNTIAPDKGIVLELVQWETHCHPSMGRVQGIINKQIGKYDIFVGIMWKRFGSPTGVADSGTEEEFRLAYKAWIENDSPQIMFYFCHAPFMALNQMELEQLSKVLTFRKELQQKGLTWNYGDSDSFADVIRPHLVQILINISAQLCEFVDFGESKTSKNASSKDTITPINTYLSDLTYDLTLWRGLNLRRDVRLEDVYVSHFLRSGYREDEVISEIDALLSILGEESQTRCILIVGLAGSGKSTLLKHWALTLAVRPCKFASKEYVPVFLPLGLVEHLSGGNDSWNLPVVELAAAMFCDASGKASPKLTKSLVEAVNSGHAIILLDAADEVSEESRPHFRKWYDMVRRSAKRCPIVLTSRPSEYVSGIENLDTYYLRSLKQKQRELFISQWFQCSDRVKDVSELKAQLKHSRLNVPAVAGNPLFLTMICVEFEATGRLSSTPAKLFDQFIRILLELWDIERGVIRKRSSTTLSLDIKLRVLESIAFYFFERRRTKFSESELIAHVEALLHSMDNAAKVNDTIKTIESTSGLLIKDRKGFYQFCHHLFQEFFVARDRYEKYIRGENQKQWIQNNFFNPRFENVMQFYSELLQTSQT